MARKTFNPQQLTVSIGTHIATGYAEGTFLSIEMNEDVYSTDVDLHGNTYRYKTTNNNADITLTLNQGSPTNDVLSSFYNLDRQGDTGKFFLLIKDNNGNSLFSSDGAYIYKIPAVNYANTANNREWGIKATNLNLFVGGIE